MSDSNKLRIYWSKREKALMYYGPPSTGGFIAGVFERILIGDMEGRMCGTECKHNGFTAKINEDRPQDPSDLRSLTKELEARGYDLTTLRFQIKKKIP